MDACVNIPLIFRHSKTLHVNRKPETSKAEYKEAPRLETFKRLTDFRTYAKL
jgi:hypothetical protein